MSTLTITPQTVPLQILGRDVSQSDAVTINASVPNAFTPDPKEIAVIPTGKYTVIDIELPTYFGFALDFDAFFIGFHNALRPDQQFAVQQLEQFGVGNLVRATDPMPLLPLFGELAMSPFMSSVRVTPAFTARYIRIAIYNPPAAYPLQIGSIGIGLSWQPQWGHEWGGGRPVIDTGRATRLPGGGFGIEEGAIVGGFQWTLGDVQPGELARLYGLLRTRGNTKPVWVVEDPDQTPGLNERTHYGLFTKIEPYERLDPSNTRYGLQMEDWV